MYDPAGSLSTVSVHRRFLSALAPLTSGSDLNRQLAALTSLQMRSCVPSVAM